MCQELFHVYTGGNSDVVVLVNNKKYTLLFKLYVVNAENVSKMLEMFENNI